MMIRLILLGACLMNGFFSLSWSQNVTVGIPLGKDVKLRNVMLGQYQSLQNRYMLSNALLQCIKSCHEGATKKFYEKRNLTAVARCFDPVEMVNGFSNLPEPVIRQAYRDYLGREPDPGGLATYLNLGLSNREIYDNDLINVLSNSPEASLTSTRTRVIRQLYQQYLGREAADWEVAYWVATDKNTRDLRRAVNESPEARIRQAYRKYLGREPDPGGLANYMGLQLNDTDLMVTFSTSPEAQLPETRTRVIQQAYLEYLGRPESASEISFWLASNKNPMELRSAIFESPEAVVRRQCQN